VEGTACAALAAALAWLAGAAVEATELVFAAWLAGSVTAAAFAVESVETSETACGNEADGRTESLFAEMAWLADAIVFEEVDCAADAQVWKFVRAVW